MNQFYVPAACLKTQCPEKYICLNKTCKITHAKPHCYECLNKEHIGKNNVVQHLKEFIDLDKFMEQINTRLIQKETIFSRMIEQCSDYQSDTLQQMQTGQQLSQTNIKVQNILKDKQELIKVLRNVIENNNQLKKYSLENHEQLKIIYYENDQNEIDTYTRRLSKLKEDVENFLEEIQQGPVVSSKKIMENIKILQQQNNKNRFYHYIFAFAIGCLVLLSFQQQLSQSEKNLLGEEFNYSQKRLDALQKKVLLNLETLQSQIDILSKDYNKIQGQLKDLENNFFQFQEKKNEQKNYKISRLVGEIHQNLNVTFLEGFTLIYDYHFTKSFSPQARDKLAKIVFKNQLNPLICLGGLAESNLNQFILVGCDYATEVFGITHDIKRARKSPNGDIYWYWVDQKSFGFSPTAKIHLDASDREDLTNERRFSYWYNIGRDGGQRIGKLSSLLNSSDYRMRIYMFVE